LLNSSAIDIADQIAYSNWITEQDRASKLSTAWPSELEAMAEKDDHLLQKSVLLIGVYFEYWRI
jgi:hypothetical protein